MDKYIEISKITIKSLLIYKADVIGTALMSFFKVFIAIILWSAVYQFQTTLVGYTLPMLITYYIIIDFLQKIDQSQEFASQIAEEIRKGEFSKYIVKPMNPLFYFITVSISKSFYRFFIGFAMLLIILVGVQKYVVAPASMEAVLWGILFFLLGSFFLILFNYFITILSFYFIEVSSLFVLKSILLSFLVGELIPLSFLPNAIVEVFRFFPFYYVLYYPVELYLSGDMSHLSTALIVSLSWNIGFFILIQIVYQKIIKNYAGVGI